MESLGEPWKPFSDPHKRRLENWTPVTPHPPTSNSTRVQTWSSVPQAAMLLLHRILLLTACVHPAPPLFKTFLEMIRTREFCLKWASWWTEGLFLSVTANCSWQVSSLSETKAHQLMQQKPASFIQFNQRQLSRIYPCSYRVDSSNFNPQPFWNAGCQFGARLKRLQFGSTWSFDSDVASSMLV